MKSLITFIVVVVLLAGPRSSHNMRGTTGDYISVGIR